MIDGPEIAFSLLLHCDMSMSHASTDKASIPLEMQRSLALAEQKNTK